jgi:hypothetical protein
VSTDNGLIMARHRLIRAAKALAERGVNPPGLDVAHQRVRSASVILPPERRFNEAAWEALIVREGVAPATVRRAARNRRSTSGDFAASVMHANHHALRQDLLSARHRSSHRARNENSETD